VAIAVMPLHVDGEQLFVEVVQVAGSEPTSRLDTARDRAVDAFDRAKQAIVAVAAATVQVAEDLATRSVKPQSVEVEFGLKFSAQGNIIVAGGSGEATLKVRLTFPCGEQART
jgi:predicted oxidoreductase